MRRAWIAITLATLAPTIGVRAQDPPYRTEVDSLEIHDFLTPSYLLLTGTTKVRLEGQVVAEYPLALRGKLSCTELDADLRRCSENRWRAWMILTGRVIARISVGASSPVRTPSYIPGLTAFFLREYRGASNRMTYLGLGLTAAHHSNGQDGCLFSSGRRPGEKCSGPNTDSLVTRIEAPLNTRDGSFATNYFRGTATLGIRRRGGPVAEVPGVRWPLREVRGSVWVEYHPLGIFPSSIGRMDEDLAALYGEQRIGASMQVAFGRQRTLPPPVIPALSPDNPEGTAPGSVPRPVADCLFSFKLLYLLPVCPTEVALDASVEHNNASAGPKANWDVRGDVEVMFGSERRVGMLVRYQRGSDYYNISFQQPVYATWLFGIVIRP